MPKFHVAKSIEIEASPEQCFQTIADFGTWTTWSPWLVAEPDATVTVTDDAASVGSVYAWSGTVVGAGEIEHLRLEPGRLIEEDLRFLKPFKSRSSTSFTFERSGSGCRVTWDMHGSMPWFLFWMIPQMEAFIGMDYERGLKMLRVLIETGGIPAQTRICGVEEIRRFRVAGVRHRTTIGDATTTMSAAFEKAHHAVKSAGLPLDGDVLTVVHDFNPKTQTMDCTCGLTIPESMASIPADLSSWSQTATRAFRVEQSGPYEYLGNAWSAANQIVRYQKLKPRRTGAFEIYRNDPRETPTEELRTDVYLPLK